MSKGEKSRENDCARPESQLRMWQYCQKKVSIDTRKERSKEKLKKALFISSDEKNRLLHEKKRKKKKIGIRYVCNVTYASLCKGLKMVFVRQKHEINALLFDMNIFGFHLFYCTITTF